MQSPQTTPETADPEEMPADSAVTVAENCARILRARAETLEKEAARHQDAENAAAELHARRIAHHMRRAERDLLAYGDTLARRPRRCQAAPPARVVEPAGTGCLWTVCQGEQTLSYHCNRRDAEQWAKRINGEAPDA